jgi:hypothetical protein
MNTSFHFASAQEITVDILDIIKNAYHKKPFSIYIQDDEPAIPQWQIQEVRQRDACTTADKNCLLDCDTAISELEKELKHAMKTPRTNSKI